jgi:hypothetical protein
MRIDFLEKRSTNTPMKGPKRIGGTVCKTPTMVVFRGDPVME